MVLVQPMVRHAKCNRRVALRQIEMLKISANEGCAIVGSMPTRSLVEQLRRQIDARVAPLPAACPQVVEQIAEPAPEVRDRRVVLHTQSLERCREADAP